MLVTFIVFKPLYIFLFFTAFSYENFLFINFIFDYLKCKKSDSYFCFTVSPLKTTEITTFKIWLKINEIHAYSRLYSMLMSKKVNIKSIVFAVIIIIVGIPFKFFKLTRFLLKRNSSLHDSIRYLYFLDYSSVAHKKIEIIQKNAYLNVFTKKDIINIIYNRNKGASVEKIASIYHQLTLANNSFTQRNAKLNENLAAFKLGSLKTEEGVKIKKPHWTNETTWKINGDRTFFAVHATSEAPGTLTDSQLKSTAMPELIKYGAKNPASIVTKGDYVFNPVKTELKLIPAWQLQYTVYNVYSKDLSSGYMQEFLDRENQIIEILGPNASRQEIIEFASCNCSAVLSVDFGRNVQDIAYDITNGLT